MDFHGTCADESELLRIKSIQILLTDRTYLRPILFDDQFSGLRGSPQQILSSTRGLSRGETLLVSLSLDIWNGSGETNLHEVIHGLDDTCWDYFLKALAIFSNK